jgi:hypothetical protein
MYTSFETGAGYGSRMVRHRRTVLLQQRRSTARVFGHVQKKRFAKSKRDTRAALNAHSEQLQKYAGASQAYFLP